MMPPMHSRPRHLLRAILGLAIVLAVLIGGGVTSASAAETRFPQVGPTQTSAGYELENFRWAPTTVAVYYNWDGGACIFGGNDFSGPTTAIAPDILLSNLQDAISDVNTQLRGGLVLQLVGPATRAELCSTTTTRQIVVGIGKINSTGQTISYGNTQRSGPTTYTVARVFLTNTGAFTCPTAPMYRDLQHTLTHELLHGIGIGHTTVPQAIMTPTFVACRTPFVMQADDTAAVNALYPPTLPLAVVTSTPGATTSTVPSGTFGSAVIFSPSGQSLTVFAGGSADQLEAAAKAVGATGVWVQDATGQFRLMVVSGPAFLRDQFRAAFAASLPANLGVTLVR